MVRLSLLTLLAAAQLTCAGRAVRPTEAAIEASCQARACRELTSLEIPVDGQRFYAVEFPRSPYVAGPGLVSILPGERLHLTARVGPEGTLSELRVVDEAEAELHLRFEQDRLHGSMLHVTHDWGRALHYCAAMQLAGQPRLLRTSTLAVGPRAGATELWYDPIVQLVLHEFQLVATDEARGCR